MAVLIYHKNYGLTCPAWNIQLMIFWGQDQRKKGPRFNTKRALIIFLPREIEIVPQFQLVLMKILNHSFSLNSSLISILTVTNVEFFARRHEYSKSCLNQKK